MALLSFILECAAAAVLIGTSASIAVLLGWSVLHRIISHAGPSARAELAFTSGVLPALMTLGGTMAAALPPLLAAFGLAADHCTVHVHHLHLCITHSAGIRPALAALGSFGLASFVFRAVLLGHAAREMKRSIDALERVATTSPGRLPVLRVPGEPRLCHAIGWLRGRIILSMSLIERLPSDQLRSALAHERAHLDRRDPLANLLLSIAGLFQPPGLSTFFSRAYRSAAEEACDDHAVSEVGDSSLVAESLVAVAEIQRGSVFGNAVPAFGEHPLEGRVRRLISGASAQPRSSLALWFGGAATMALLHLAILEAHFFHHAVETVLHHLF